MRLEDDLSKDNMESKEFSITWWRLLVVAEHIENRLLQLAPLHRAFTVRVERVRDKRQERERSRKESVYSFHHSLTLQQTVLMDHSPFSFLSITRKATSNCDSRTDVGAGGHPPTRRMREQEAEGHNVNSANHHMHEERVDKMRHKSGIIETMRRLKTATD